MARKNTQKQHSLSVGTRLPKRQLNARHQEEYPLSCETCPPEALFHTAHPDEDLFCHTFSICAYKDSPYLESCIKSLLSQSESGSHTILCTSTPSLYIEALCKKHGIPCYVREGASSLKDDWNFAVETAVRETGAELVTIAHQDDVYDADYVKELKRARARYPELSLFFTRYDTIDERGELIEGKAEAVKRILRLPYRISPFCKNTLWKRLPLRFGNAVCCPSCTYAVEKTGLPLFQNDYRFVIDWETLYRIAGIPGRFVCAERPLLRYRVHGGAETMANIKNHNREREEEAMYQRMWGKPIAKLLMHFYKKAYSAYD